MKPIINYEGNNLYLKQDEYTINGRVYLGLVKKMESYLKILQLTYQM